jgi:lysine N6-hydroxylase
LNAGFYDLVGVGLGPFNLSVAALAEPVEALRCLFLDERPGFSWHPGMMVDGATLQVPFLADLVTLVDPTSRYSYLAYLRDASRLFGFYFAERSHVPRVEYEAYCRTVAQSLRSCRFGARVTALRSAVLSDGRDGFAVCYNTADRVGHTVLAANVVLGIGTEPVVPAVLRTLCEDAGPLVTHSAQYLDRAGWIRAAQDVTVLGSGQSGAEVVLDLLRSWHRPGRRLRWLTRSAAFEPMEYSKLGLEHFTPDYADHFHSLPQTSRDALIAGQGRLYKAVSVDTLAEIRAELDARTFPRGVQDTGVTLMPGTEALLGRRDGEELALTLRHTGTGRRLSVRTERLILATGYAPRRPDCLAPINTLIERDGRGRPVVSRDHRIRLAGSTAGLYVQNAEMHTHGVGAPDLGLGAFRAATIVNAVAGRPVYPLPGRTSHTVFAPTVAAAADPGIALIMEDPVSDQPTEPSDAPGRDDPRSCGPRHAAAGHQGAGQAN